MSCSCKCLLLAALSFSSSPCTRAAEGLVIAEAPELQSAIFGQAAQQGWLGGDHLTSLPLHNGGYIWLFGDVFTNLTQSPAKPQGDEIAQCNFFPAQDCALPTNAIATWNSLQTPTTPLSFRTKFDKRTGRPTSNLWPPGWGSSGRTPKRPNCNSCSLWAAPTLLNQVPQTCNESHGEYSVEMDKGGCCSSPLHGCPGYCCSHEMYFRTMVGVAARQGSKLFLLAQMGKESDLMPLHGSTFGTYGVVVRDIEGVLGGQEEAYEANMMPGTHVWPWSKWHESVQFFSAMSMDRAHGQVDLVYILGFKGPSRVLARAPLDDLLEFRWNQLEFWAAGGSWQPYEDLVVPELAPLWNFSSAETSLHFDERLGRWIVPEVRRDDKVIVFHLAEHITGPYQEIEVGQVPLGELRSQLHHWDVQAVKHHPELSGPGCHWALSMVFKWLSRTTPPPAPGLHHFPRILCVHGDLRVDQLPSPSPSPAPSHSPLHSTSSLSPSTSTTSPSSLNATQADACTKASLQHELMSMACEPGSGCHSCQSRAKFLISTEGHTLEGAYALVAAQFPDACGAFRHCSEREIQRAFLQAWEPRVPAGILRRVQLPSALLLAPLALLLVVPFSLWCRRRRLKIGCAQRDMRQEPGGRDRASMRELAKMWTWLQRVAWWSRMNASGYLRLQLQGGADRWPLVE